MRRPSLVDLAVESRAREQCEEEFFYRSPHGPQKARSICIKCLVNEVETVRGKHCKACRYAKQMEYLRSDKAKVNRARWDAKQKTLLKKYEDGEL